MEISSAFTFIPCNHTQIGIITIISETESPAAIQRKLKEIGIFGSEKIMDRIHDKIGYVLQFSGISHEIFGKKLVMTLKYDFITPLLLPAHMEEGKVLIERHVNAKADMLQAILV